MSADGHPPIRMPPRPSRGAAAVLSMLLASSSASGGCISGGVFQPTGNDTAARFFHRASLLSNGFVMVTGGMRLQLSPLSLISLGAISFFNPATATFSASFTPLGGGAPVTPTLGTPRSTHTQSTLIDGRVLITGGYVAASGTNPGVSTTSVEVFDPQTGIMTPGPPMTTARAAHTGSVISNGAVIVAGGSTWQVFDPTGNAWSADHPLQQSRIGHAAVVLPNQDGPGADAVLLIGGTGSGPATMEILHPATGLSTLLPSTLMIGVDDVAATRLDNGLVLIVGGQDASSGNTISLTYLFNPADASLTPAPPPPNRLDGIADHQIIAIGPYAVIFGGEQEISGVDTELTYAAIYDSTLNAWQMPLTMSFAHDDFPAILLNDGRMLLIGGGAPFLGQELPSAASELFTPGIFMPGDLNKDHAVNLLDIPGFASTLLNAQPDCLADMNASAADDGRDVQPFVGALTAP